MVKNKVWRIWAKALGQKEGRTDAEADRIAREQAEAAQRETERIARETQEAADRAAAETKRLADEAARQTQSIGNTISEGFKKLKFW